MRELPFPAVVNQEDLKLALLLNAVNNSIGGVLIRGEKGTGKSSTVRGLKRVLPEIRAVKGCVFNCHPDEPRLQCGECRERADVEVERIETPVVELPLGATEDRVVGSLDVERALSEGVSAFEPGLLARANRGILYIDEVNLLDDHLTDVLLDAAASGVNRVEREGVSVEHPADFILVGTMNPDEGHLRPQFLDRFGLRVDAVTPEDVDERAKIIEVSERFDRAPDAVIEEHREAEEELGRTIETARETYDDVEMSPEFERWIADICIHAGTEGSRGDIITARCARTLAALDGRTEVAEADLRTAIRLALPHRTTTGSLDDGPDLESLVDSYFDEERDGDDGDDGPETDPRSDGPDPGGQARRRGRSEDRRESAEPFFNDALEGMWDFLFGVGDGADDEDGRDAGEAGEADKKPGDGSEAAGSGRSYLDPIGEGRAAEDAPDDLRPGLVELPEVEFLADYADDARGHDRGLEPDRLGKYVKARSPEYADGRNDVAIDASLRSAARRRRADIGRDDVKLKVRGGRDPTLVVFAVDSSASMRAHGHIETAKRLMTALFRDVCRRHDSIAVIAFRDETADLVVPPTNELRRATRRLDRLQAGNKTPLSHGLHASMELVRHERTVHPDVSPILLVMTDGRPTVALDEDPVAEVSHLSREVAAADIDLVVLDMDKGVSGTDVCKIMASEAEGEHVTLYGLPDEDKRDAVAEAVRALRSRG